jgi:hypothetical protein
LLIEIGENWFIKGPLPGVLMNQFSSPFIKINFMNATMSIAELHVRAYNARIYFWWLKQKLLGADYSAEIVAENALDEWMNLYIYPLSIEASIAEYCDSTFDEIYDWGLLFHSFGKASIVEQYLSERKKDFRNMVLDLDEMDDKGIWA